MKHNSKSLLQADSLSCSRGDNLLFQNLNFSVHSGEIYLILGTNGAGKTSLLRILCGLSQPESGHLLWNGKEVNQSTEDFCSDLLYIGHRNGIKSELTPLQNLVATSEMQGKKNNVDIEYVLDQVGLYGHEDTPCRFLSAGQQRRVAIARLYLSTALLWILDEPVTALDTKGIESFQILLENHAINGGIVLLTSHQSLTFGSVMPGVINL